MRYLKSVSCRLRKYMSMQSNQPAIPDILKMRLWTAASLIVCVLAAGIFMEYQLRDGFLRLSCICSVCLGIRFFELFLIVYRRKYRVIVGEVVRIQICGIRKKEWEVTLRNQFEEEKTVYVSRQSHIRKGKCYRIYLKGDAVFCIEKQEVSLEA